MTTMGLSDTMTTLPVMEHFYTLQGEGFYQGQAAYFIRLGGCDVGCVWCDVKDSWDASLHPRYTTDQLTELIQNTSAKIAVITGGEPLMHDLTELTSAIQRLGIRTHIETSGSHPISGSWDWICLSPKKFKAPLESIPAVAHELKVVIFNKHDIDWAEKYAAMVGPHCKLYLQPEWEKRSEMTPLIVDHIKKDPRWQLSLQVHKYIDVP